MAHNPLRWFRDQFERILPNQAVRTLIFEDALIAAIVGLNPFPNLFTLSLLAIGVLSLAMMRRIRARWGYPKSRNLLAIVGNFFGGLGSLLLSMVVWVAVIALGLYFPSLQPLSCAAAFFTFVWATGQATNQYYATSQLLTATRAVQQPLASLPGPPPAAVPAAAIGIEPALPPTANPAPPRRYGQLHPVKRRQLLLATFAAGAALTSIHEYFRLRRLEIGQASLSELLRQSPTYVDHYLQAAFSSDATSLKQLQALQQSLQLVPPQIPYDRPLSRLLIRCSRLGTEQYLMGTIVKNYDGSLEKLPSYEPSLSRYRQVAAIVGPEEATAQQTLDPSNKAALPPTDPLAANLDQLESIVEQLAGQAVVLKWLYPVYWGFVLTSPEHSILVYRGTQRMYEWVQNIMAEQVADTSLTAFECVGNVHRGFATIYGSLAQATLAAVKQLDPARPLYITGHSLGAAIATLAAMDLALRLPQLRPQLRLYTYASPRTGDPTFARQHSRLVPNSYRVLNVADAIPLAPPSLIGNLEFAHVGQPWSFLNYTGDISPSHLVSTYRQAIDQSQEKATLA